MNEPLSEETDSGGGMKKSYVPLRDPSPETNKATVGEMKRLPDTHTLTLSLSL